MQIRDMMFDPMRINASAAVGPIVRRLWARARDMKLEMRVLFFQLANSALKMMSFGWRTL